MTQGFVADIGGMWRRLHNEARSRAATPEAFRHHIRAAARDWVEGERWSDAWAPHLSQCRTLLDTMIDDIKQRRTVVVLGSGAMRELPIESLGRCFERVVLVDRAHLAAGIPRIARYPQIERIWAELSFATEAAFGAFISGFGEVDWVISANVLPELGAGKAGGGIISAHLQALAALPCPATLITGLDRRVLNRHGVLLEGGSLLRGHEMPRSGQRWKWERRPFASARQPSREVYLVGAWADWRER